MLPTVGRASSPDVRTRRLTWDDPAVTNPPAIGGVGAAVAIAALKGENPDQVVTLTPEVFDHTEESDLNSLYDPEQQVGWSTYVEIAPWTNYEAAQVSECAGPGE